MWRYFITLIIATNYLREKKPVLKDQDLILPCKDGYDYCTEKTLQALKFVAYNLNFDYIFRTNLGSYVNFKKIIAFLEDKPMQNFYSGIIGRHKSPLGKETMFASGSGYFLSQDLVKLIAENSSKVSSNYIDDVAIGEFLANSGISINHDAIRLSYVDDRTEYQQGEENKSFINPDKIYHVRLRSSDRNHDIARMHELFNLKF